MDSQIFWAGIFIKKGIITKEEFNDAMHKYQVAGVKAYQMKDATLGTMFELYKTYLDGSIPLEDEKAFQDSLAKSDTANVK